MTSLFISFGIAFLWGFGSHVAMPIGAVIGTSCVLRDSFISVLMAFGAGSLLFALTLEMFGEALSELDAATVKFASMVNVLVEGLCAVLGAVLFQLLNRLLDHVQQGKTRADEVSRRRTITWESVELLSAPPLEAPPSPGGQPQSDRVLTHPDPAFFESMDEEPVTSDDHARLLSPNAPQTDLVALEPPPAQPPPLPPQPHTTTASQATESASSTFPPGLPPPPPSTFLRLFGGDADDPGAGNDIRLAHTKKNANSMLSIWLGLMLDCIPEGLVMGSVVSATGHLPLGLFVGIFLANFPEALASSAMMMERGLGKAKIYLLWTVVALMVGLLSGTSALLFPEPGAASAKDVPLGWDVASHAMAGTAAGAMLATIIQAMLPEALEKSSGNAVGLSSVVGRRHESGHVSCPASFRDVQSRSFLALPRIVSLGAARLHPTSTASLAAPEEATPSHELVLVQWSHSPHCFGLCDPGGDDP
ncbi:hypothetical protein PAPYR_7374 [Paratrimastix pyriformis]|uniref:Zinc transporter ZIP11 n=1 Tax=Paratrimastix pyriformis TaxID=342808 RepID=A0ABQ8UEM4_9EUKA|nr:hypothetical protein PAPYR_7374 [Paratrimastix pyriformis]